MTMPEAVAPTLPRAPGIRNLLLRLWRHQSRRRRWQLGLLMLVMLLSGVAELFSLAAVLPLLAALTDPQRLWQAPTVHRLAAWIGIREAGGLLLPMVLLFSTAAVFAAAVRLTNLWMSGRLAAAIGSDLSCEVYRRTLHQSYAVHVQRDSSAVIAGTTTQIIQTVDMLNASLQMGVAAMVAAGLLVALLVIDWPMACVAAVVFGGAYGLLLLTTRRRLEANSAVVAEATKLQVRTVQEGLGAIRDVLLDGSQATYLAAYREADRPLRQKLAQSDFIGLFPRYGLEALGLVLIAVLALLLTWQRGSSALVIPALGALALGAQRLLPALQSFYGRWAMIRSLSLVVADVLAMLDQPMVEPPLLPVAHQIALHHDLRFERLRFRYTPEGPWVLNGMDLSIRQGERLGLIGSTGSGKSTVMDLLMGLLAPTGGKVLLDGLDLNDPNHPERLLGWRASIAHVPQSIYLADGSMAENIAFGIPRDQIEMSRVRQAAERAQIAGFIESQVNGYKSVVGERGIRLSGGQRQRIGIARALYKQAQILVLDEATSALDPVTEEAVMESIEALGRELTVIIIAHRLSTLSGCDRVVELAHGSVLRIVSPSVLFSAASA